LCDGDEADGIGGRGRTASSAPNARIAAKEALAARDIAGMDDDVRLPPALRAVNWVQTW